VAASLGDYLQFDVLSIYLGQNCHNVFYYKVNSITGLGGNYLEALCQWMETNVLTPVAQIQADAVEYVSITAKNLTNVLDFHVEPVGFNGVIASVAASRLPSWVAASFKLNRETLATRNGWKRFTGMQDGQVIENTLDLDPGDVAAIEAALASDIVLGLVNVAQPVIVKRPLVVPLPTTHVSSGIGSAQLRPFVGSQNSRKPGVGE
jgi:hypothetical protein